jgi:hypothetical protein
MDKRNLILCNCGDIIGCEVLLPNGHGVAQKLCYKTCAVHLMDCQRIIQWERRRFTNFKCPTCEHVQDDED